MYTAPPFSVSSVERRYKISSTPNHPTTRKYDLFGVWWEGYKQSNISIVFTSRSAESLSYRLMSAGENLSYQRAGDGESPSYLGRRYEASLSGRWTWNVSAPESTGSPTVTSCWLSGDKPSAAAVETIRGQALQNCCSDTGNVSLVHHCPPCQSGYLPRIDLTPI